MSLTITRPNGRLYRPRRIRCVSLASEGRDGPIDGILVFGTHEVSDARARAEAHLEDEIRQQRGTWCEPGYTYQITADAGERVWFRRVFHGFYEDLPVYGFQGDPVRGAAAVQFDVDEIEANG